MSLSLALAALALVDAGLHWHHLRSISRLQHTIATRGTIARRLRSAANDR